MGIGNIIVVVVFVVVLIDVELVVVVGFGIGIDDVGGVCKMVVVCDVLFWVCLVLFDLVGLLCCVGGVDLVVIVGFCV